MRAISLGDRFEDATGWLALAVIALVIVAWVLWSGCILASPRMMQRSVKLRTVRRELHRTLLW
jgi:hypothetical protein